MAVVELVPKTSKPTPDVSEVLEWLDRTKENVIKYGVHSIAIAWVDAEGGTGSGWISHQPAALLGSIEVCKSEFLAANIE